MAVIRRPSSRRMKERKNLPADRGFRDLLAGSRDILGPVGQKGAPAPPTLGPTYTSTRSKVLKREANLETYKE